MSGKKPARERGLRYPIKYVASELGIDPQMLVRECTKAEIEVGNGLKFSEAYTALSGKIQKEKTLRRRQEAEAHTAEVDAADRDKLFVLKSEHEQMIAELATVTRAKIQSAEYIPKEDRQRLTRELAEVKVKI